MLYHARSRKAASQGEQKEVTNSSPVKTVLESLSHPNRRESQQARNTGRHQRLEREREMNLPTRPAKIEDVPFRRQDRRTLNARYRRIMDRKLILCIAGSGLLLLGLGAGLLVVHSMFKEECSYIRPFIVIGPVLIGGSFMTLLFSVEICTRLYHNTKRVKDPDMD